MRSRRRSAPKRGSGRSRRRSSAGARRTLGVDDDDEAALRALHGDLALLLPTMSLVVALIALIICNYHQLIARFPQGGGAAAAAGAAFGEGWTFIPIGALIVDFVLTIAISVAAARLSRHRLRPLDR